MSKILKFQSLSNQTIIKRMRMIMFYVSRHLRAEPIQYYIYYVIDLTSDPIVLNVLRIEKIPLFGSLNQFVEDEEPYQHDQKYL